MKAKEYYSRYQLAFASSNHEKHLDTTAILCRDFLAEAAAIREKRRARMPSAVVAIFEEQEEKWKSLSRMINSKFGEGRLDENFFHNYLLTLPYYEAILEFVNKNRNEKRNQKY